jgi:hypothetical protein
MMFPFKVVRLLEIEEAYAGEVMRLPSACTMLPLRFRLDPFAGENVKLLLRDTGRSPLRAAWAWTTCITPARGRREVD